MNEQLEKVITAIRQMELGQCAETGCKLQGPGIQGLNELADYALSVEKMLNSVVEAELEINKDLTRFVGVLGGWKEARMSAQIYPSLLEAFEATQNDSNGRGTQG